MLVQRVTVALRAADAVPPRRRHLGPVAVVLERGQGAGLHHRVADHGAVGGDEGDAGGERGRDAIGFGVQRGGREVGGVASEEIRHEPGFRDQGLLDARLGVAAQPQGCQGGHEQQRRGRHAEGGQERLSAEPQVHLFVSAPRRSAHPPVCSQTA
jgi:hypothetical protein